MSSIAEDKLFILVTALDSIDCACRRCTGAWAQSFPSSQNPPFPAHHLTTLPGRSVRATIAIGEESSGEIERCTRPGRS